MTLLYLCYTKLEHLLLNLYLSLAALPKLHGLAFVWFRLMRSFQWSLTKMYCSRFCECLGIYCYFLLYSYRVAENESINKMSLHNLATVFGPTLLRPSEKDSKISNSSQPISMNDSWSLEVMAQVQLMSGYWWVRQWRVDCGSDNLFSVFIGSSPSLLPSAGEHSNTWQQTSKPSLLYWSITGTSCTCL